MSQINLSLVIYIAMAFFVLLTVPGLIKLIRCGMEFRHVSRKITSVDVGADLRERIRTGSVSPDELFRDKTLAYQFELYQSEIADQEHGGRLYSSCDIGSFFHPELLEQIGNKVRCDNTGTTLTTLGILGTFLGLAVGLRGFNFTDTNNIIQGIENLLEGMSTAFWTSIWGIVASLIFTSIHHRIERRALTDMDSFLDMFRKNVLDDQTDTALSAIVDKLSPLENMNSSLADAVGKALGAHMDGQMDKVISAVETACYEMAKYQAEAMRTTTNAFAQALQDSLGTHFNDLGQSIDRASQEYGAFAGQLSGITNSLREMSSHVSVMENWSERQMESLKDFSAEYGRTMASFSHCLSQIQDQMREMQQETAETFDRLDGMLQAGSETIKAQKAGLEEVSAAANNLQNVLESVDTAVKQISEDSETVAENTKQTLAAVSESVRAESDAFTAAYEKTLESCSDTLQNMQKTYADQLKEMTGLYEGELREMAGSYTGQLKNTTGSFARELNEQMEAYLKASGEQMNLQTEIVKEEIERLRSTKRRGLFGRR